MMTGKFIWSGEIAFTIDFSIDSSHTPSLAGTRKWSDTTNSLPLVDIAEWKATYEADSGKVARYAVCNQSVMTYLVQNDQVLAVLSEDDKKEVKREGKITRLGGLDWMQYDAAYTPEGGSATKYMSDNKVVLWSGDAHREYSGICADTKATTPGKFSKSWESEDPSGLFVKVAEAPCPSAERITEFFCATVHS